MVLGESGQPETDYGYGDVPQKVKIGIAFSFVFAALGILVGGYIGWLLEGGHFVLVGCAVGFVAFFFIAFAFSGTIQWLLVRAEVDSPIWMDPGQAYARHQATGLQTWDMHVSIHRVQNLYNAHEHLPFSGPEIQNCFAEVLVGRLVQNDTYFSLQQNPPMRTCVQTSGVFEESFHVNVTPTDNTVRIVLYSQEILTDKFLGYCDIDITSRIIDEGFPQKEIYNLINSDGNDDNKSTNEMAGTVVLSFSPGSNLAHNTTLELESKNRLAFAHMRSVREPIVKNAIAGTYGDYGTWATQGAQP